MGTDMPQHHPDALWHLVDGQVAAYSPELNKAQVLNETASAIWCAVNGERTIDDITKLLAEDFDISTKSIHADVKNVVTGFGRDGLLAGEDAPETVATFALAGEEVELVVPSGSRAETLLEIMPSAGSARLTRSTPRASYRVRKGLAEDEWDLVREGDCIVGSRGLYLIKKRLVADFNRLVRDQTRFLAVHAGVVAQGDAVVAFPALSGSGKSTLAAGCVLEGFDYVSDEALLIDRNTALVVPYQKPFQLSEASLHALGLEQPRSLEEDDAYLSASQLGAAEAPSGSLGLAHVVVPHLVVGCQPKVEALPRAQVVAILLDNAFNHHASPRAAFELALQLADAAQAWSVRVGDPRGTARLLAKDLFV